MDARSETSANASARAAKRSRKMESVAGIAVDAAQKDALEQIQEHLQACPAKILPCLMLVKGDALLTSAPSAEVVKDYPPQYGRLDQIPKATLRKWILQWCNGAFASDEQLLRIERAENGTVQHLFFMALRVSKDTVWPSNLKNRMAVDICFNNMYTALGDTQLQEMKIVLNSSGKEVVDWSAGGVFVLQPEGSWPKTAISHRPSGHVAALDGMNVVEGLVVNIKSNWSEMLATLEVGKSSTLIANFFEPAVKQVHFLSLHANDRVVKAGEQALKQMPTKPVQPLTSRNLDRHDSESGGTGTQDGQNAAPAKAAALPPPVAKAAKVDAATDEQASSSVVPAPPPKPPSSKPPQPVLKHASMGKPPPKAR
eukprot:6492651-Amphidinium_carterae.3